MKLSGLFTCAWLFEAKAKLFTKKNDAKPEHKLSIQSGDRWKLNRYKGQNTDGVWKDVEKLVELIDFRCVFILLAAAERDGGSLQGSHLIFANHCY